MNREKLKRIVMVAVVVIACIVGIFRAGMIAGAANDAKPGSVNDPLITKSYLDSYMSNLNISGSSSQAGYKKVELSKGSTLIGQEGTEILLYSGSANAYVQGQSIVNMTLGETCANGMTLGKYCVYLCPDQSSGLTATSQVVIFVKGQYSSK